MLNRHQPFVDKFVSAFYFLIESHPSRRHRERSVAIQSLTQKPEFVAPLPAVAFLRRLGGLPRRFASRNLTLKRGASVK